MSDIDTHVDRLFEEKSAVDKLFGYRPDWVEIPYADRRSDYWMLIGGEGVGARCVYSSEPFSQQTIEAGKTIYSGLIYTQRFLPKWVYRTETHVLVSVNTQTDGNKFLMVFRADRECTDEAMRAAYTDAWGSE